MNKAVKYTSSILLAFAMAGCATPIQKSAQSLFEKQEKQVLAHGSAMMRSPVTVMPISSVTSDFFVDQRPVFVKREDVEPLPASFSKKITISRSGAITLTDLTTKITRETGIPITFSQDTLAPATGAAPTGATPAGAPPALPGGTARPPAGVASLPTVPGMAPPAPGGGVSTAWIQNFEYTDGDLKGLLDIIASRENLSWRLVTDRIEFSRYVTKTFVIAGLAGTSELTAKVTGNSSAGSSGGSGSSGVTTTTTSTAGGQTTSITSKLSLWDGVRDSVKAMLSTNGRLFVSEPTGTITVTDTPSVLTAVESFMKSTNRRMTRKVFIATQVFSVQNNESSEVGVNWNAVWQVMSNTYGLALSTPALTNGLGTFTLSKANVAGGAVTPWNTSEAIFGALSSTAKTSLVTSTANTTLSGQSIPLNNTFNRNYIASIATTAVPNAGVSTSIQQATLTTGFSINLTPVVMDDNQILLQTAIDLSALDEMLTLTSGGQTVQAPSTSSRNLMNRVSMRSGETLIISGLEQVSATTNASGLIEPRGLESGGSRRGSTTRSTLVIAVTPVVVD